MPFLWGGFPLLIASCSPHPPVGICPTFTFFVPFGAVFCNLFRTAKRFETEFFFVDRPLKNRKCFSNKTARIYPASKSANFDIFSGDSKEKSLHPAMELTLPAKCFKFKALIVKTQTNHLQSSLVFANHCYNAFNLEKYAAQCLSTTGLKLRVTIQQTMIGYNLIFDAKYH